MKKIVILTLSIILGASAFAQKQIFDILKYSVPHNWTQTVMPNGIQLSTKDDGKGSYAAAVIVKSVASTSSAQENFNNSWESLVKGTVKVTGTPTVSDMSMEKGWKVLSGQSNYKEGSTDGVVMLITATGNEKMANVVIMTNTSKYQEEILAFVNNLELIETATVQKNSPPSPSYNSAGNTALVGLWTNYKVENNGYSNGLPMVTGGYSRSEYLLKADGTYVYREKNWLVYGAKDILFVYETGKYSVIGNQISFSPTSGKGGWWAKTKSTKEWGSFLKSNAGYRLEKKTHPFEIKQFSGSNTTSLILKTGGQEYSYSLKPTNESLIDNPPGF